MVRTVHRFGKVLAACAVLLVSAQTLVSAGSADVGITPAYPDEGNSRSKIIFIMTLEPGETGTNGVRLINSGTEKRTLQVYPVDGSSSVDGSFSCRQESEDRKEVGMWVNLSEDTVSIEPGAQKVVDFDVTVPDGTSPGEHNGCIAVQDLQNVPAQSGEGILLGFRSAIRLAVTVPGDIIKKLELKEIKISQNEGKYEVMPLVKNTGNVSLDVKSYIQLESIFKQKTPIKSDSTCPVVPGATQSCGYSFERPYWGGIYRAHVSMSYNSDPNDGIGQNTSKQTKIRKDSSLFFMMPDPLAALAELAVLATVAWLAITPFRRRVRRKRIMRSWEKHLVEDSAETIMSIAAVRGAKWRRIAKMNHLRAPYTLRLGQTIIVPKPKSVKQRRQRRQRKSELDWFLDDQVTSTPTEPAQAPQETPQAATPVQQTQEPKHVAPQAPSRPPEPSPDTWVTPGSDTSETYDENYVDWREGANPTELQDIETRLGDYTAVPRLRSYSTEVGSKAKKSAKSSKATISKKTPKRQAKPKKRK